MSVYMTTILSRWRDIKATLDALMYNPFDDSSSNIEESVYASLRADAIEKGINPFPSTNSYEKIVRQNVFF